MKNKCQEYKNSLSGALEYEGPVKNPNYFVGFLKIKKDPKVEQLNIENFIPRGSIIRKGEWIFGLVVFTGKDTKIILNSDYKKTKHSFLDFLFQIYFLIIFMILIILAIISYIMYFSLKEANDYLQENYTYESTNFFVLYTPILPLDFYMIYDIVILYLKNTIEITFNEKFAQEYFHITNPNVFSDLSHVQYALLDKTGTLTLKNPSIHKIFFNGKIYEFNDLKDLYQKIQNLKFFPLNSISKTKENAEFFVDLDFKMTEELENNIILYSNKREENFCKFIPNSSNIINPSQIKLKKINPENPENPENPPENSENIIESQGLNLFNYKTGKLDENHLEIDFIYDSSAFCRDLENIQKSDTITINDLFEMLTICHYSTANYEPKMNKIIYNSRSKEEEIILEFCQNCNFSFITSNKQENPDIYQLKLNSEQQEIEIIGINDYSNDRKLFSLVYRHQITKEYFLICKGLDNSISAKLDLKENDREKYQLLIKHFQMDGLTPIIYARKKLNEKEAEDFKKKISNLKTSLINQTDQLADLASEIEINMNLMIIIGIKENINPDSYELIKYLKSISINPWIMTGDTKDSALNIAYLTNIITPYMDCLIIEQTKKEELILGIRNILSLLKRDLTPCSPLYKISKKIDKESKNENKFMELDNHYLLINGESLDLIVNDPYLEQHFIFISYITKTIIGYNLSPNNKKRLALMIKKDFPRKPTLMAIGDGFNDILMLQEADIGIEIVNKNKENNFDSVIMAGDIKISSLKQIKELMGNESILYSAKIINLINFSLYKSLIIGIHLFLYNFFTKFTGTIFYNSELVFLYFFYFVVIVEIFFVLFYQKIDIKILKLYPKLYFEGLYIKRMRQQKKIIFVIILEALFVSIFVFYISLFVTSYVSDKSGIINDKNAQNIVSFYSILLIISFKVFFQMSKMKKIKISFFLLPFIGIFMVFLYVIVSCVKENEIEIERVYICGQTRMIFKEFENIMIFFLNTFVGIVIYFVIKHYFTLKFYVGPYDLITFLLSRKYMNIDPILKTYQGKKIHFSSIIKKIFKKHEWIDVLIQEMLSPDDIDAQELKLNKYNLEILDSRLERKYNFSRKKKSVKFSRVYFLLLTLTFSIYVVIDLIINTLGVYGYIKIVLLIICISIFFGMFLELYTVFYYKFMVYGIIIGVFLKIMFDWLNLDHNISISGALLALISTNSMNLNIKIIYIIVLNSIHNLHYFIRVIFLYYGNDTDYIYLYLNDVDIDVKKFNITISLILLVTAIILISLILNYKLEKQKRNEFLAEIKIDMESAKVQDILAILVPRFVRINLNQGNTEMAEEHENVSIIFCDIYNFDKIITTENEKVVQILDNIYRFYDSLCLTHGIQKIETVGKTYMAASGLQVCDVGLPLSLTKINKTTRLINMAFEMMKFIENVTYGKGEKILIKIGIHTGKVIAGVIGYHKPQFSLIGDTVNTTSRVCSTGEPSTITLSEEAMIEGRTCDIIFTKKVVQAKGKGDINTYKIKRRGEGQNILKNKISNMLLKIEGKGKMNKSLFVEKNKENDQKNVKKNMMNTVLNVFQNNTNSVESREKLYITSNDGQSVMEEQKLINLNDSKKIDIKEDSFDYEENDEFNNNSIDDKRLVLSKYFLRIPKMQNQIYDQFLKQINQKFLKQDRFLLLVLFVIYIIRTLILISLKKYFGSPTLVFFFRAIFSFFLCFSIYKLKTINSTNLRSRIYRYVVLGISVFGMIASLLEVHFSSISTDYSMNYLEILLNYLIHSNICFLSFLNVFVLSLIMFFLWILICSINNIITVEYISLFIAFIVFSNLKIYLTFRSHVKSFNKIRKIETKRIEQETLVSQLLPLHAYEKLKEVGNNNKVELIDVFSDVTLLFADIVNFTKYSASVRPQDVVKMLRNLFSEFDKMCVKHKVYKVYTIGDCYVVMGFLQAKDRNPVREAKNVVKMGLSMIEIIRKVRGIINFPELDMRIGIHTGNIIGGIIGTDIVRYDIYGKDVLIANKMESNGVIGNIMVSESTKKLLEKEKSLGYIFEKKKEVECKGLEKPMPAYLIHISDDLEKKEDEIIK